MRAKIEAYVDTSALIALLDRSDAHHDLFRRLFASPPPLVSSAMVIAEGHGWFLRRFDSRRAMQFLAFVEELPFLQIVAFDEDAIRKAGRLARRFADQNLTLADAHGLLIARERKCGAMWSVDRHLALTGVPLAR